MFGVCSQGTVMLLLLIYHLWRMIVSICMLNCICQLTATWHTFAEHVCIFGICACALQFLLVPSQLTHRHVGVRNHIVVVYLLLPQSTRRLQPTILIRIIQQALGLIIEGLLLIVLANSAEHLSTILYGNEFLAIRLLLLIVLILVPVEFVRDLLCLSEATRCLVKRRLFNRRHGLGGRNPFW